MKFKDISKLLGITEETKKIDLLPLDVELK